MIKYGFCELDITPQLGCVIPGYFKEREVEEVATNLYVKAIVADDGKKVSAICVVDALCVSSELCNKAVASVADKIGIDPAGILIQATHAHTGGPMVEGTGSQRDELYRAWVTDKVSDCIVLAYKRREAMSAVYNMEKVYGVSFVRNYIMRDGTVRTNAGFGNKDIVKRVCEADPDMRYLFFTDASGKARGALVNFACHHDCIGGTAVNADYSGVLAKELRKKYGKDFICVFMNGFCGNINHWDCIGRTEKPAFGSHIRIGQTLAEAVVKTLVDAREIQNECVDFRKEMITVKRRSIDPQIVERAKYYLNKELSNEQRDNLTGDVQGERYLIATAPSILRYYGDEAPGEYEVNVQAIRLGDCIFYATAGEMFSQYGEYLKKNAPTDKVFLAEMAHGLIGYVPIAELYNEPNVYEATPRSCTLHENGGMEMTKKAEELGNRLFK